MTLLEELRRPEPKCVCGHHCSSHQLVFALGLFRCMWCRCYEYRAAL